MADFRPRRLIIVFQVFHVHSRRSKRGAAGCFNEQVLLSSREESCLQARATCQIILIMNFKLAELLLGIAILGLFTTATASADWHIVLRNVVSGPSQQTTNTVSRKISGAAIREDLSPEVSLLFLSQSNEHVILNHAERTYIRQRASNSADAPSPPAATEPQRETYNGAPVRAFRWTNGPVQGCTWLALAKGFFADMGKVPQGAAASSEAIQRLGVGSLVGTNEIVVATQSTVQLSLASGESDPTTTTQTAKSTLVAIAHTNCAPAEFEIPADYREVPFRPPSEVKFNPAVFGSRMQAFDQIKGLQKRFENGRPPLQLPNLQPANK